MFWPSMDRVCTHHWTELVSTDKWFCVPWSLCPPMDELLYSPWTRSVLIYKRILVPTHGRGLCSLLDGSFCPPVDKVCAHLWTKFCSHHRQILWPPMGRSLCQPLDGVYAHPRPYSCAYLSRNRAGFWLCGCRYINPRLETEPPPPSPLPSPVPESIDYRNKQTNRTYGVICHPPSLAEWQIWFHPTCTIWKCKGGGSREKKLPTQYGSLPRPSQSNWLASPLVEWLNPVWEDILVSLNP